MGKQGKRGHTQILGGLGYREAWATLANRHPPVSPPCPIVAPPR